MKILVVESNAPEVLPEGKRHPAADQYGALLSRLAGDVRFSAVTPYEDGFDAAVLADLLPEQDGVVFTGSANSWSTDDERSRPLWTVMEQAFDHKRPCFGSCNGMQLAAVVLGGRVGASPKGLEIGLTLPLRLTGEGQCHRMMDGRKEGMVVPCIHRDEVQELPPSARLLAGNDHSPVQAFATGPSCGGETGSPDFWGVQYHPELGPGDIADYINREQGLFSGREKALADWLEELEQDSALLAAIKADPDDLILERRTSELANWLDYIRSLRS